MICSKTDEKTRLENLWPSRTNQFHFVTDSPMDQIIAIGANFACQLVKAAQESSLRVSLCYSTDGNRYALGIAFWVVSALLIGVITLAAIRREA